MTYKDPICGMTVEDTSPHRLEGDGRQIYFCSDNCKKKYLESQDATDRKLKDPVCGMDVTPDSPHHFEYENTTFYFCSAGCRDKFASDPGKFANVESHHHAGHH